jgi:MYXO-CTERM domain-containing protein
MRRTFLGLGVSTVLFVPAVARAEPALALIDSPSLGQQIVSFDTTSPRTITRTTRVTGLALAETLVAMDVRPSTGDIHVLSSRRNLYSVSAAGAATLLITIPEAGPGSLGAGDKFDMDFNPTGEAVRLVNTQTRDNLRVVLSPAVAIGNGGANDEPLSYAPSADNGDGPNIVGIGYSNNFAQTTSTRLFGINVDLNTAAEPQPAPRIQLVELTSETAGHFNRVVPLKDLGIPATSSNGGFGGYDVSPNTGSHYFSLVPNSDLSRAHLYMVNAPGTAATFVDLGAFGNATEVRDIAIPSAIPSVVGYVVTKDSKGHKLSTFDSARPRELSRTIPIEGLSPNENILAMDRRPKTDTLYVVTSASRLLRLDRASGFCTPIGTRPFLIPLANPTLVGMDFNPAGDAVRVVSGTQNFVIDPESGAATEASPLSFVTGDPHEGETPNAAAAAYTRNVNDGGVPRLFVYSNKAIASQGLALDGGSNGGFNSGKLETLADLPFSGTNTTDHSFDVVGDDLAFLSLTTGNGRRLYQLDLRTGALRYGLLFGQVFEPGEQIVGVAFEAAGAGVDGGAFGDGGFTGQTPPFTSPSFPSNPGAAQGQGSPGDGVSCDCSTVPGGPAGGATAVFGVVGVAMMLRRRKGTEKDD